MSRFHVLTSVVWISPFAPGEYPSLSIHSCWLPRPRFSHCKYLAVAAFLVASVCGIARYLQLCLVFAVLPFMSSIPSVWITFPLFVTIQPYFSSLIDILIFLSQCLGHSNGAFTPHAFRASGSSDLHSNCMWRHTEADRLEAENNGESHFDASDVPPHRLWIETRHAWRARH